VPSPDQLKRKAQTQRGAGGTKIGKILLIKIDFLRATKLECFVAGQWKIARVWAQILTNSASRILRFFQFSVMLYLVMALQN